MSKKATDQKTEKKTKTTTPIDLNGDELESVAGGAGEDLSSDRSRGSKAGGWTWTTGGGQISGGADNS